MRNAYTQISASKGLSGYYTNGTYRLAATGAATTGDLNTISSYLSGQINNKLDTSSFSEVSGTFLTAVNIPESANWNDATTAYQTNSGDYLKESELGYNAVDEVSAINGSAIAQYGAEKQWLVHDDTLVHASNSAQYALGVAIDNVARLLHIDETVLWSGARTSAIQTSESMKNFDKCQVYIAHGTYGPPQVYTIDFADMGTTGYFAITRPRGSSNLNIACIRLTADDTHLATVNAKCLAFGSWSTTATGVTATTGEAEDLNSIIKVVGIGRKQ
jgi:hypothetical protein